MKMKRIFTFFAAISMVMIAMAQSAGITVSTNGSLKFFSSNQLAEAIEAAQPNDTIYLAAGQYSYNNLPERQIRYNNEYDYSNSYRMLTKPLTFIGAGGYLNATDNGKGTRISGDYTLAIDIKGVAEGVSKNVSFEGLSFANEMCVASEIDNLTFRNFYSGSDINYVEDDTIQTNVKNILFDRSSVSTFRLGEGRVGAANFLNSKIRSYIYGSCTNNNAGAALNHCYIYYVGSDFKGLIRNSLIYSCESSDAVLQYTGYYSSSSQGTHENCYKLNYSSVESRYDNDPANLDATFVTAENDGTPLGTLGGNNPYSLYPSFPTPDAEASTVEYDVTNKKLNVVVKILGVEATPEPAPAE